jgi:hypothetical protein
MLMLMQALYALGFTAHEQGLALDDDAKTANADCCRSISDRGWKRPREEDKWENQIKSLHNKLNPLFFFGTRNAS